MMFFLCTASSIDDAVDVNIDVIVVKVVSIVINSEVDGRWGVVR